MSINKKLLLSGLLFQVQHDDGYQAIVQVAFQQVLLPAFTSQF